MGRGPLADGGWWFSCIASIAQMLQSLLPTTVKVRLLLHYAWSRPFRSGAVGRISDRDPWYAQEEAQVEADVDGNGSVAFQRGV